MMKHDQILYKFLKISYCTVLFHSLSTNQLDVDHGIIIDQHQQLIKSNQHAKDLAKVMLCEKMNLPCTVGLEGNEKCGVLRRK
jgi:hypothetical protein